MNDLQITLNVTAQQANLILSGLSKLPYEAVSELISSIMAQGSAQVAAAKSSEKTETATEPEG